jgi:hypothetical protein
MQAQAPAFPKDIPDAYRTLEGEPVYEASIHLELSRPGHRESLADFGYSPGEIAACPSPMAVAGPFHVLSPAGVAAVAGVLARLRSTAASDPGARASNYLGGGVYKSKFLRDLCACPVLTAFMSEIAGTTLVPHAIPHQQLYVNFAPEDISKAVDNWHIDSVDFDCVILLEEPYSFEGGHFQYFRGTDTEAAALFNTTVKDLPLGFAVELPAERIGTVQNSRPGDGALQQGSRVVHRAERLLAPAARTTLVISYASADVSLEDRTNVASILSWDHPGTAAELGRHCAWRSQARLLTLIDELSLNAPREQVITDLRFAMQDVENLLRLLES